MGFHQQIRSKIVRFASSGFQIQEQRLHESVISLIDLIYNPRVMCGASNPGVVDAVLITDNA